METIPTNATIVTLAQMAAAHGGSMAGGDLSGARVRSGHIKMRHLGKVPSVHPKAYVAPTAVLSGEVSIGAASCVLHGAVLGAEGGPVQVDAGWVIMENAVLRGTLRRSLVMGDRVLAGPHAQLTGGGIAHEVFIAADVMVLSGARLGRVASVAVGSVVHLGAIVAPQAQIPTGWVAVGDPARAGRADQRRSRRGRVELPATGVRRRRRRRPPRPAARRAPALHRGHGPPPPPGRDHPRPPRRPMTPTPATQRLAPRTAPLVATGQPVRQPSQ
jgi:carbonic anhydrase/acetyltransferase-like protein (isoleucine patch superfamily)